MIDSHDAPSPPSHDHYDACIVGAGPAGSLSALLLARLGRRVLLVDKRSFPRAKVCGGCLGGVAMRALEEAHTPLTELGVEAAPLRAVVIRSGRSLARLTLGPRAAIARDRFDDALLLRAREEAAEVRTGWAARISRVSGTSRPVTLTTTAGKQQTVTASLVILAAGLGGAALVEDLRDQRVWRRPNGRVGAGLVRTIDWRLDTPSANGSRSVTMICDPAGQGYVGAVRLPDGRCDLAAAIAPEAIGRGRTVGQAVGRWLKSAGIDPPDTVNSGAWTATPALTQRPLCRAAERLLIVGDSAGYVEPFTGEGIGWALRGAVTLAPIANAAIADWQPALAHDWERRFATTVGAQHARCRFLCGVIGARRVTPAMIRILSVAPWLAAPVLTRLDRPVATASTFNL